MRAKKLCYALILAVCPSLYANDGKIIGVFEPDDPNICVPSVIYHSSFQNYQVQRRVKIKSWQKANEMVSNTSMNSMHNIKLSGKISQSAEKNKHYHRVNNSK